MNILKKISKHTYKVERGSAKMNKREEKKLKSKLNRRQRSNRRRNKKQKRKEKKNKRFLILLYTLRIDQKLLLK